MNCEKSKPVFERYMSRLYRLALLLTGDREQAIEAFSDATGEAPCDDVPFSTARSLVITNALRRLGTRLKDSMSRVKNTVVSADVTAAAGPTLTPQDMEKALLSIDIFPRCALLLTTFEGLTRSEAARLLDADTMTIRCGQIRAIADLMRHAVR
jgi:hypothetical protein